MKNIFLISILLSFFSNAKSQVIYKNDLIEIKGYVNLLDSSLLVKIINLSDSTLVLNGFEPKYTRIKHNFVAELSLMSTGVSLLQPGLGDIMFFKRLLPKSNYTVTISKGEHVSLDISKFNLIFGIQYLVVSNDFFICDRIINKKLVELVKEKKISFYDHNLILRISDMVNNDCMKILTQ